MDAPRALHLLCAARDPLSLHGMAGMAGDFASACSLTFERRLIYIRESIVLGEEDELKTDGSMRDIQMSQLVFDALKEQCGLIFS